MPDAGQVKDSPSIRSVLLTPRWLLAGLLAVALAVGMVFLGIWQLHRFELRSSINDRIDAHAGAAPVAATTVLRVGHPPLDRDEYTRVTLTGRYDPAHQILARARTVDGNVGYEIIVPVRLADGTAVLVDRGWLPPRPDDPEAAPRIPAAPTGQVTVTGEVRMPESEPDKPVHREGRVEVRRIDPAQLAATLPYPAYGGYVTATGQRPAASSQFVAIPIDHQNAAMNFSYILQWWLFSGTALVGFVLLVRWETRKRTAPGIAGKTPQRSRPRRAEYGEDRVPEDRVPEDRVPG